MEFSQAVDMATKYMTLSTVNTDTKLMLYGYYKLATEGMAPNTPRDNDMVTRMKWAKWHEYSSKYSQEESKQRYCALIQILAKKHDVTE